MTDEKRILRFWNWFKGANKKLMVMLDRRDSHALSREISSALHDLEPGLKWEIGPGKKKPYSLTIRSSGDSTLRALAKEVIGAAPEVADWEFYSHRQSRDAPPVIEFPNRGVHLDTTKWQFFARENLDTKRIDITVVDRTFDSISSDDALRAIFIYLDSALGEEVVEEWIGNIQSASDGPTELLKMSNIRTYVASAQSRFESLKMRTGEN